MKTFVFLFSRYSDRILIPDPEIRRLLLRLTRKWSSKSEAGKELDQHGFDKLQRRLSEPKYSFLKCLMPVNLGGTSHLYREGSIADVISAVAKDVAPIANGVVKNYDVMKPIFE